MVKIESPAGKKISFFQDILSRNLKVTISGKMVNFTLSQKVYAGTGSLSQKSPKIHREKFF